MRVVVSFPIEAGPRMEPTWPVQLDERAFSLRVEKGIAKAVCVIYHGVHVGEAPTINSDPTGRSSGAINIAGSFNLTAERDIRAWQAMLAAYVGLTIRFDQATTSYHAETAEEDGRIVIKEFTAGRSRRPVGGMNEFSVYGRAFLAIPEGYGQIDRMAFYLEGATALEAQRPIDAYNSFYLWFEANYHLPFKTKDAVRALCANDDFVRSLRAAAEHPAVVPRSDDTPLKASRKVPLDVPQLVKEIVELRGFLRHNSMSNPARWDPANQGRYADEASFLATVANGIAFPTTMGLTWGGKYVEEFNRQAEEKHCMTDVNVVLAIKEEGEIIKEVALNMRFPTTQPSPMLAKAVLQKAVEAFEHNSPGAELFGMRARVMPNGPELFRYDLGPAMSR